jgi:hypothetical protein
MSEMSLLAASKSHRSTAQAPVFGRVMHGSGSDMACIDATGEVDLATAPWREQALREPERYPRRALDLRDVPCTAPAGVHVILGASETGARLVLLREPSHVDLLFASTGTAGSLEIVDLRPFEPHISAFLQSAGKRRQKASAWR